jgi:hypothetical protein
MKSENNAIAITSIIGGVILIIALVALLTFNSAVGNSRNSVTVQGISTIKASPDLITVYFNIETVNDTASQAQDANEEIYDDLVFSLIALGFDRDEIQTESFSVYPNYEWDGTKQEQNGYKAVHSVKLELSVNDSDKLSDVVEAGIDSGAGISYINFELTQESQNKYKAQALELAAEDAKIKADAVADGFGKNAGKLVSVSVSDFGYYPWNLYSAKSTGGVSEEDAASARATAMNISPSDQEITATVSATFRIR